MHINIFFCWLLLNYLARRVFSPFLLENLVLFLYRLPSLPEVAINPPLDKTPLAVSRYSTPASIIMSTWMSCACHRAVDSRSHLHKQLSWFLICSWLTYLVILVLLDLPASLFPCLHSRPLSKASYTVSRADSHTVSSESLWLLELPVQAFLITPCKCNGALLRIP